MRALLLLGLLAFTAVAVNAQAVRPIVTSAQPANFVTNPSILPSTLSMGGAPVLPQNFMQPQAAPITQPVLTPQQANNLVPIDQLQAAFNQRVASLGQFGAMYPAGQQPLTAQAFNTIGAFPQQQLPIVQQQQQPWMTQQQQQPWMTQQPLGFGGVQQQPWAGVQQPLIGQQPLGFTGVPQQQFIQPMAYTGVQQPVGFAGVQQQPWTGVQQPLIGQQAPLGFTGLPQQQQVPVQQPFITPQNFPAMQQPQMMAPPAGPL